MSREFAGTLKERITIERQAGTRNAMALQEDHWVRVAACRAAITLDGAGAEGEAQALSAMPRWRVTIRRREGVEIDQRIRWGKRAMRVRQVLDDPTAPDRLTMRCEEVRQ